VLSQDFYPDFQISRGEPLTLHERESKERYAISRAVQRKQALAAGVPIWNCLRLLRSAGAMKEGKLLPYPGERRGSAGSKGRARRVRPSSRAATAARARNAAS